jgi:hypothetical protein
MRFCVLARGQKTLILSHILLVNFIKMKFNKEKIIEIALTALISALLAFLQGLLTQLGGSDLPHSDPVVAGGIGAGLKSFLNIKKC